MDIYYSHLSQIKFNVLRILFISKILSSSNVQLSNLYVRISSTFFDDDFYTDDSV